MQELRFWTLSTKNVGAVYVFNVKKHKIKDEKGHQWS